MPARAKFRYITNFLNIWLDIGNVFLVVFYRVLLQWSYTVKVFLLKYSLSWKMDVSGPFYVNGNNWICPKVRAHIFIFNSTS